MEKHKKILVVLVSAIAVFLLSHFVRVQVQVGDGTAHGVDYAVVGAFLLETGLLWQRKGLEKLYPAALTFLLLCAAVFACWADGDLRQATTEILPHIVAMLAACALAWIVEDGFSWTPPLLLALGGCLGGYAFCRGRGILEPGSGAADAAVFLVLLAGAVCVLRRGRSRKTPDAS